MYQVQSLGTKIFYRGIIHVPPDPLAWHAVCISFMYEMSNSWFAFVFESLHVVLFALQRSIVNNVCLVVHQLMKECVDTLVKGYTTRIVAEAPSLIQNNEVPSEYVHGICICSCKQYTQVHILHVSADGERFYYKWVFKWCK